MGKEAFDILADVMRFWFIILILYILYMVVRNSFSEYSLTRQNFKGQLSFANWLVLVDCPDKSLIGNMVGLRNENNIGNKKSNDIILPYEGVSKQHCVIYNKGGKFKIDDLKSRYGTFVNDERIDKKQVLKNGDTITCGAIKMKYVIEEGERNGTIEQ